MNVKYIHLTSYYGCCSLCGHCRVLEMLQGKGAGKNGRFQGKANSLAGRGAVEALLQERCRQHAAGEE